MEVTRAGASMTYCFGTGVLQGRGEFLGNEGRVSCWGSLLRVALSLARVRGKDFHRTVSFFYFSLVGRVGVVGKLLRRTMTRLFD